ncbi:MAG: hypothetical protein F6K40_38200, partial [Okeania sp. SIO3I5]|nr:hypothetical protein [Okeania sp. SIO3I5]
CATKPISIFNSWRCIISGCISVGSVGDVGAVGSVGSVGSVGRLGL